MKKIYFYKSFIGYKANIDGKIYLVTSDFFKQFSFDDNIEILTIGINRSTMAKIISKFSKNEEQKRYMKQIIHPKGLLCFGIFLGKDLKIENIPVEIQCKRYVSKDEWNKAIECCKVEEKNNFEPMLRKDAIYMLKRDYEPKIPENNIILKHVEQQLKRGKSSGNVALDIKVLRKTKKYE